jgi:hypothetical protein
LAETGSKCGNAQAKVEVVGVTPTGQIVLWCAGPITPSSTLGAAADAILYAFDLLDFNGEDLRPLPLAKRKDRSSQGAQCLMTLRGRGFLRAPRRRAQRRNKPRRA